MTDALLVEGVDRLLRTKCTAEALERAETAGWEPDLWAAAAQMGLPWISVPEESGGSGGNIDDALEVLKIAGQHAAPIPLAETGLLAGWLSSVAGLPVGRGPATVVPGYSKDTLSLSRGVLTGRAHRVAWARVAERVVAIVEADGEDLIVSVPTATVTIEPVQNLAGEPRDTVVFDELHVRDVVSAPAGVDTQSLLYRGALTRVMLIAGALETMAELTVQYARDRHQFGVSISTFQAVQEHLVQCAGDAALVAMAAAVAAREALRHDAHFEIASAKLLANRACTSATRAAHQVHGAMGITREYPLNRFTRRLWSWRSEYGTERLWARSLGVAAHRSGADLLYPAITGGSKVWDVA